MKNKTLIQECALWAAVLLPAVAQAQFNYTTNAGAITITGYSGSSSNPSIPGTINGLPVIRIGDGAFQNNTNLTGVGIASSITNIGAYAFSGYTTE